MKCVARLSGLSDKVTVNKDTTKQYSRYNEIIFLTGSTPVHVDEDVAREVRRDQMLANMFLMLYREFEQSIMRGMEECIKFREEKIRANFSEGSPRRFDLGLARHFH